MRLIIEDIARMLVECDARGEKRACGAACKYVGTNRAQGHAFYRCPRPGCHNLMVVCINGNHVQREGAVA